MINIVKDFVEGTIEIKEFISRFLSDNTVRQAVDSLILEDAKNNPKHCLWKRRGYSAYEPFNFSISALLLKRYKFDLSVGDNLNIWGSISTFAGFSYPKWNLTTKYEDEYDLYLSLSNDIYEGPDVNKEVEKLIKMLLESYSTKTQRLKVGKILMKELFHLSDNQRPYWIQGAEWPGDKEGKPLKFISQKRKKDKKSGFEYKEFVFQDVNTNEMRTVIQYY